MNRCSVRDRPSGLGRFSLVLFAVLALSAQAAPRANAQERADRVVVLANSNDRNSMRVAQHYAQVRHVPVTNIVALPMTTAETISWTTFVRSIWNPLEDELVRRGWIDAIPMDLSDELGRRKFSVSGQRIDFLVVCRGVPLRISHDAGKYHAVRPFTDATVVRTNAAAVDSELSLLAVPNHEINAYRPNPLFAIDRPTELLRSQVVKVSRLDGPSVEDALGLVDLAVSAEIHGLAGRAYVDMGGVHPDGDRWLEDVARQLEQLNFDTAVERSPSTFRATARFDAPVLYFGWYTGRINGPFRLPGFRFPPGAIALHIHSFSAATLHNAASGWCGPLIARGATVTLGNVFEPYLQLTHRPDFLLKALARGDRWGDAVCYAQPVLSWQTVAIGDPLFRPFASLNSVAEHEVDEMPEEYRGYAIVREIKARARMASAPLDTERSELEQVEASSLAVALEKARLVPETEIQRRAAAVESVATLDHFRTDEWAAAHQAAEMLSTGGRDAEALHIYRVLFDATPAMPPELWKAWRDDAVTVARKIGDREAEERWSREPSSTEVINRGQKK